MNGYLKYNTASQVRTIGPFVSDTDFKTLSTGLTIANTDIKIKKNGGTAASKASGGATADSTTGLYHLTWGTGDTDTVGELSVAVKVSGALVYFCNYTVLTAAVYDMLFGSSATGFISDTTRASQASVDTLATYVDTEVAAIKSKTDNLPADPADASDLAASFATVNGTLATLSGYMDTEVAAILAAVDTEVAAIKAKTDALPTDPADASDIAASFTSLNTKVDTIDDFLDTEISAIKTKTDQLTFTGGTVDANATIALAAGDLADIAQAILKHDWTTVSGEAAYSLLNAARMLRNVWNTTGGTLTVKKEDGSTNAWQRTLSTDPTAEPIVGAS